MSIPVISLVILGVSIVQFVRPMCTRRVVLIGTIIVGVVWLVSVFSTAYIVWINARIRETEGYQEAGGLNGILEALIRNELVDVVVLTAAFFVMLAALRMKKFKMVS